MSYILLSAFLTWFVLLISFFVKKRKKKKCLLKIRSEWGHSNSDYRNFDMISYYSTLTSNTGFHTLSSQILNDIDFQELFCHIDRTSSKPGQQLLYDKLIRPSNDIAALEAFNRQVNYFSANKNEREEAQLILSRLNKNDALYITTLLNDHLLEKPKWVNLLIADTVVVILMLLFSAWYPVLLIWLLLPLGINLFFHFWNKKNSYRFSRSFPQLNLLLNVCRELLKKEFAIDKNEVHKSLDRLKPFRKKLRLLNFGDSSNNEMAQMAMVGIELVKAFFLIEVHSFFSVLKTVQDKKKDIDNLIRFAGGIDAAIAVASLRSSLNSFCTPVFTAPQKEMQIKEMYHPLIENCVANSLHIKGKGILITGSNMSGKSTFIRTIAINSILAQTIYTCFATEFITPLLKLFSSVRITDDLMNAKSYYFEEVNIVSELIKQSNSEHQNLFMLDEVFKGTNTIERVAAAKAILSYLNKNKNLVMVSTHDIELAVLLKEEYDLYHFVEDIEKDTLQFDHTLKQGPLTTRNAIKILELAGYPGEIISEARRIAGKD